jgi:sugar/nucleoside kinase (ribokinase family)
MHQIAGKAEMNRFDMVFMGYLGTYTIVPFAGPSIVESGGPAFYCSMTASHLARRVAMVTRVSDGEAHLLELLRTSGVQLFAQPWPTPRYRAVFATANVDERQVFLERQAGPFGIDDVPPIEPCLIHLAGWHISEFSLEFMQELKALGFRLSVDMQAFVFQTDHETGRVYLEDIPDKREILSTADFVKLDAAEAEVLTGTDVVQDQAALLEEWGSKETVITYSEGALARSKGKTTLAKFTNRSIQGRMGRGDTVMAAYLAQRLDHSVEDSIRFAAALTSIKLEYPGPFRGSQEDVVSRMNGQFSE